MPEVKSRTISYTYESLKPESASDHDLLVGICQDIFGFNPDACFRENIVDQARRRFHEVKAEVAKLELVVAARDETIRKLNGSYGKLGTKQRMLNAEIAAIREENARLLAEHEQIKAENERLKAELEDTSRQSARKRKPILPSFLCMD